MPGLRATATESEVFCQHIREDGTLCRWNLTDEPIDIALPARDAIAVARCRNGHTAAVGDLICRECGAEVLFPELPEIDRNLQGLEEREQTLFLIDNIAKIGAWEATRRIARAFGSTECFSVRRFGEDHGPEAILSQYPCGTRIDDRVYDAVVALAPGAAATIRERGEQEGRIYEVIEANGAAPLCEIDTNADEKAWIRALVSGVGSAIHRFSRAGVRHRDLRPEAILVGGCGRTGRIRHLMVWRCTHIDARP